MNTDKYGLTRPFTALWKNMPFLLTFNSPTSQRCTAMLQPSAAQPTPGYEHPVQQILLYGSSHQECNVNRKAGVVCIRSWNLSFTPSEHRGTLQWLWCPMSFSGYASLSPLLICCFCYNSLHLDHVVNPCSPCGDFMVPIKPNNPNLLSSQSSHYPLQDPAVFKSLTIYIYLLCIGDMSLSSSFIVHLTSALIRTPTTNIPHPQLPWQLATLS